MSTCSYCDKDAVTCIPVRTGEAPAEEKHVGTWKDLRKVVVIRLCADHKQTIVDGLHERRHS